MRVNLFANNGTPVTITINLRAGTLRVGNGPIVPVGLVLGSVPKGEARNLRKRLRRSGLHRAAAALRCPV